MEKKKNLGHDLSMWKGANAQTFSKARELRGKMTPTENLLWNVLNEIPFRTHKFRRQHPFGHYILDFYSHQLKLSIEVDGEYHQQADQLEYDRMRTEFINFQGIKEMRFTNREIEDNLEDVIKQIHAFIESSSSKTL
ncbi:endonuclease domain-containing protein [Robertkochia aurantiaca]|uniref:endonuclease domain-containing protein n=1 Tax=Robertkochia aurantiaca TaxID=2873700 RepID=UPI001CCCBCD6|nr:endonuclease domain-containing protein [Robertkochia sp. 3YJGBD-33]